MPEDRGVTDPDPFSVIVTDVALPPKVFPETVTGVVPHVLPLAALSKTTGGFSHPHETGNTTPVVVHPSGFLTVIKWLPLLTLVKTVLLWKGPALRLYSIPVPTGLVIVIIARLIPWAQSKLLTGISGPGGCD